MADDIAKKLDELRRQAAEKLHEARGIVAQMNTVETLFELPLTALADLETAVVGTFIPSTTSAFPPTVDTRNQQAPKRRATAIRPDEFFGDEPMEAAKKFMRSIGYAVTFDEIADAVQKGGAVVKGADWKDRLEISLKRSPYQVVTVGDRTYGLAEFYTEEQLNRFRGTRRRESQASNSKKKKAKGGWPKGKPRGTKKQAQPQPRAKKKTGTSPVTQAPSAPSADDAPTPVH